MKTRIITTLGGIMFTLGALAQQQASFSQYFFNPMYINPAYAGSRGVFSGTAVYRTQWVGMPGSPVTESVGMSSMIPGSSIGLGLQFYNDELGSERNTGMSAIFAYHLRLNESTRLAFGLEGCMNSITVSFSQISTETVGDPSFTNNNTSAWTPDANAGLYLYKDQFFVGVSVKNLLQPNWGLQYENSTTGQAIYDRNYYYTMGFVSKLSENIGIRPSILLNYVQAAPIALDIDASLIFFDKFYIGAGFRTDNRIDMSGMDQILVLSIEYDVASIIRFGYSYDVYLSRSGNYTNGTHEIMLGWDIPSTKTKMSSPKYF